MDLRQLEKAFRGVMLVAWCVGAIAALSAVGRELRSLYGILLDH